MGSKRIEGQMSGRSFVEVTKEPSSCVDAVVHIQTSDCGASLTKEKAFELIEAIVEEAGLEVTNTSKYGLSIAKPESGIVARRRDELAWKFVIGATYDRCSVPVRKAIDYIVEGELASGALK